MNFRSFTDFYSWVCLVSATAGFLFVFVPDLLANEAIMLIQQKALCTDTTQKEVLMERANKICRILSLIPGEGSTHAFLKIRGDVGGFDWKAVCALEELVARQKWMRTKGKSEADREWLRSFYNGELQY